MGDVFDELSGQARAVRALRHYVTSPVHAYLFSGRPETNLHDALRIFATALQCPANGCGTCETCRLTSNGLNPDVYWAERAGVAWRIEEIREAERVSRRRPVGPRFQIIILEDVELMTTGGSPSAAALLKSLEEPPARTIFLLSARELPSALDTIVSRCVTVEFGALRIEDLVATLVAEGASADAAREAATAAGGDIRRARVLLRDSALAHRVAQWRRLPDELVGPPAVAMNLVAEIQQAIDAAALPLVEMQEEEMARREAEASQVGQRGVVGRKEIEAQFKREQRRFRHDELRFGLSSLTEVYRERLNVALREGRNTQAPIRAIEEVAATYARVGSNVDETLLLSDLLLRLGAL